MPHRIRAARTAQYLAVRALTAHGLAHPLTLALLATASMAAARAWDRATPWTRSTPHPRRELAVPADLRTRYMDARRAWADHAADCGTCTTTRPGCPDGIPLWERYCRLQDAYLTHLRTRGTQ